MNSHQKILRPTVSTKSIINGLRANLNEHYKELFCIFQELIQNADDAKATTIWCGQLDCLSKSHPLMDTPGIFMINDGNVSEEDLHHIFCIADSNKDEDSEKVGQFGLGMKSVFHLCEAFFVFGRIHDEKEHFLHIFNPWEGGNNIDEGRLDPLDKSYQETLRNSWETIESDVFKELEPFYNFSKDGLGIWIPFRTKAHCGQREPIQHAFPCTEELKVDFTPEKIHRIAEMMPFLKHLRNIRFCTGFLEQYGSLEMNPKISFSVRKSGEWSGTIISSKKLFGKMQYEGKEWIIDEQKKGDDEGEHQLKQVGICLAQEELFDHKKEGELTVQECLFLPLSDKIKRHIKLSGICKNIVASFHGTYLVDAGRRGYDLPDDAHDITERQKENQAIFCELTKYILPTLSQWLKKSAFNNAEIETIVSKFSETDFWGKCRAFLNDGVGFYLSLGKNGWEWTLRRTDKIYALPGKNICVRKGNEQCLWKNLYKHLGSDYVMVQEGADRLSNIKDFTPWEEGMGDKVWDSVIDTAPELRYSDQVMEFLQKAVVRMTDCKACQIKKFLKDINASNFDKIEEPLKNILREKYSWSCIQVTADNLKSENFNFWKHLVAVATDCLPFASRGGEETNNLYSADDLKQMLPLVEHELSARKGKDNRIFIQKIIGDFFAKNATDVNWNEIPYCEYKLVGYLEDSKSETLSISQLKVYQGEHRLFTEGGDEVKVRNILRRVVKDWNPIILPSKIKSLPERTIELKSFEKNDLAPVILETESLSDNLSERIELLIKLEGIIGYDKNDLSRRAARYLIHGNYKFRYYDDDFYILDDSAIPDGLKDIAIKMLAHYQEKLNQPSVECDDFFNHVTRNFPNRIGVKIIGLWDLFKDLTFKNINFRREICVDFQEDNNFNALISMEGEADKRKLLEEMPIWPHAGNWNKALREYDVLSNNSYLETDESIPETLLKNSVVKRLDILDEKTVQSLKQNFHVTNWTEKDTIIFSVKFLYEHNKIASYEKQDLAEAIRDAMVSVGEDIKNLLRDDSTLCEQLWECPLFQQDSESLISFMDILPGKKPNDWPECGVYFLEELDDSEQSIWKHFFDVKIPSRYSEWTRYLGKKLNIPAFSIGKMENELCLAGNFLHVFKNIKTMPILSVIKAFEDSENINTNELLESLSNDIPGERLSNLCTEISDAISRNSEDVQLWNYLQYFCRLITSVKDYEKRIEILNKTELPNGHNKSKPCRDLVANVDGIDPSFLLNKHISCFNNAVIGSKTEKSGFVYENQDKSRTQFEEWFASTPNVLREYFKDWPRSQYPNIGAFLALIGGDTCLANEVSRYNNLSLDWYLNALKGSIREDFNNIPKNQRINDLDTILSQHDIIVGTKGGTSFITTYSLTDIKTTVPLVSNQEAENLFIGEKWHCCRNGSSYNLERGYLYLSLRYIRIDDIDNPDEKYLELLVNTSCSILFELLGAPALKVDTYWKQSVTKYFKKMGKCSQLNIDVMRQRILKSLPDVLAEMGNLHCDDLKDWLRVWNDVQKNLSEAEIENKDDINKYRQEEDQLKNSLKEEFKKSDCQKSLLKALRYQIGEEHYGYTKESIPFELFQNADDASLELEQLQDSNFKKGEHDYEFIIQVKEHALNVLHFGRAINQYRLVGSDKGEEFGKRAGFDTDMFKMLLPRRSDKKADGLDQTGKFGLGFKSIFLLSDSPLISSGNLSFRILGGMLPEQLKQDEDRKLQQIISELHQGNEPTLIHLPFSHNVKGNDFSLDYFKKMATLLVQFSKMINKITVYDEYGPPEYFIAGKSKEIEIWDLTLPNDKKLQLAFGLDKHGYPLPLSPSIPSVWVTCPTQIKENLGVAINGNFFLDVGRGYLLNNEPNAVLGVQGGKALYQHICHVYKHMDGADRDHYFQSLWDVFTNGQSSGYWRILETDKSVRKVLSPICWGDWDKPSGYGKFIRDYEAIPTHLNSDSNLYRMSDISYVADELLTKFWDLFRDFWKMSHCDEGAIVSFDIFKTLSQVYYKSSEFYTNSSNSGLCIHKYTISSLMNTWINQKDGQVAPEFINGKKWSSFFQDNLVMIDEWGSKLKFLNTSGEYSDIYEISFNQQANLNSDYDSDAKVFINKIKDQLNVPFTLYEHLNQTLLTTSSSMTEDVYNVYDINNAKEDIENNFCIGINNILEARENSNCFWSKIKDKWKISRDIIIPKYNKKLYGEEIISPLPYPLESNDDRDRWMKLFVIASSMTLGRIKLEQSTGFINWCTERGYWEIFIQPNILAKDWMNVIDSNLENNSKEYGYWMRLYPSVYQFNKYLNNYVDFFHRCKNEEYLKKIEDLVSYRYNSNYEGSDIDMPDLKLGLGRIGVQFFLRELWRTNTLRLSGMERFCFVESERNRQYFKDGELGEGRTIYDCLKKYGVTNPTFDGQFDLVFDMIRSM